MAEEPYKYNECGKIFHWSLTLLLSPVTHFVLLRFSFIQDARCVSPYSALHLEQPDNVISSTLLYKNKPLRIELFLNPSLSPSAMVSIILWVCVCIFPSLPIGHKFLRKKALCYLISCYVRCLVH